MPRNFDTVKPLNLHRAKSKVKVIEWEMRVHSWGIRDVPVEVSATASQPKRRKRASRQPRSENNDMLQGEIAPQPMDIDEAFCIVRQPEFPSSANLTYLSDTAHLHWRISPQDWPLLMLPPRLWRHSGDHYMPELQVCSVRVEVLWLLSCTCTLQGVLPRVAPAPSFSQSSKMGRTILHAIVVARGWSVLAIWALWRSMPESNCAPLSLLHSNPI